MPDAFFSKPKQKRKRKRQQTPDEEDNGNIDDLELRAEEVDPNESGSEDDTETPAQKRLRLAKLYLTKVQDELADGEFDAADVDRDLISARLKQDVSAHAGKVHLHLADKYDFSHSERLCLRGHRFSVTSAVATSQHVFTSGKEGSIVKWSLRTGKKVVAKPRLHKDAILSLAASSDERLIVSSGLDHHVSVWDADSLSPLKTFTGPLTHRDAVPSVAFRQNTRTLYSGSFDRTIKVYDLSPGVMGYVETLFGHQDNVVSLDSLQGDSCVSVGSRDRTCRFWKITDETQLVFRGGVRSKLRQVLEGGMEVDEPHQETAEGTLESVAMIDETTFVTGGDSGTISLWHTTKKKPVFSYAFAHTQWITSLAALPYSDIFASGSGDSTIRLWKLAPSLKSFAPLAQITLPGVINSLQLRQADWNTLEWAESKSKLKNDSALLLVAAVGQEHRLGRWVKVPEAKNCTVIIGFSKSVP